ncbi:hypothetical protein DFH28DRAFT_971851 [Melampsora americana]|nr:hypothetical protein DFH28DRAFT_971851 [Melampsora americana]
MVTVIFSLFHCSPPSSSSSPFSFLSITPQIFSLFAVLVSTVKMSRPYSRSASDRSKKKSQNRSPDNDTQSLVNSLPASLRFLKPQASQSSSKTIVTTVECDQGQDEVEDRGENEESDCNSNQSKKKNQQAEDQYDDDKEEENDTPVEQEDHEDQQDDDDHNHNGHDNDEPGFIDPEGLRPPYQHHGGSVPELFRTADPAVPSVRRLMAPGTREKFDQVAKIFSLEPTYQAEALRLGSITGDDNRYWTLLCLQQLQRQELAKSAANSCTEWIPKPNFASLLNKIIRLALRDSSIQSYTETLDADKGIISGSFHRKAMEAIMAKSKAWKIEYLPSNFGSTLDDLSNHEKFMIFFKAKLRHARDDLRLILLKEIVIPQRKISLQEPPNEVPDLGLLLGHLYNFFDANEARTKTELLKAVDIKTQARFAYLRMALGIFHNTSEAERKKKGGLSNWRLIDLKLAELRSKSRDYRQAFNAIVLARDQGLFNGNNKWDEIKTNDQFQNPSEDDVITTIPFLPAHAS